MSLPETEILEIVRDVIGETLADWLNHGAPSARYINSGGGPECGCCVDFADDVYWALDRKGIEVTELGIYSFLARFRESGGDEIQGNPFDRPLLAKFWPTVVPPAGLTWDDLDQLSIDADFEEGTHGWVFVCGLHFDAECPEGTLNFFDLPFFKRVIAGWKRESSKRRAKT